ncbi:MAG TPA: OmpA family protein [Terriglobales bacterium]|nr:OmpA family protein [Terriglobales bacterium]
MKKLTLLMGVIALVLTLSVVSYPIEMKGKIGLGAYGGLWKPVLTDHSDIFTVGFDGGATIKYGILKNLAIGVSGTYLYTWEAKLTGSKINDGAGFTFTKADSAWTYQHILAEAAVYYYFMPEKKFTPYVFGGGGVDIWKVKDHNGDPVFFFPGTAGLAESVEVKDQEITALVGGGIEYYPSPNVGINIGAKFHYLTHLLTSFKNDKKVVGTGTDQLDLPKGIVETFIGVNYYFGKPKDSDKDGVPDKIDQCPDTPIGCIVDAKGCPMDADNDGICDGLDKCPNTPKGCKVDATGCPMDADGDGVCDGIDKCPNTPKGVKVDATGCPPDADGDGVPDYLDKCPDTPKACKVDANGCPIDSDKDGVCDGMDKCPDTPAGKKVDANGCPVSEFIPEPEKPIILHGVNFETNKALLTSSSKTILDQVAASLIDRPDVKVEVGGYTDSKGSDAINLKLSNARADAVKQYLISKGVKAENLTAKGYGKANPIADNKTEEGRAENRRVELKRIQ